MEESSNSRVIILDTDIRVFEDLSRTIQNWGLIAEVFTQPRAAVEYVDEKGCDVVLLDVLMPETCSPDLIPRRSIRKKLKINGHYNLRNFLDSRSSPRRSNGSDNSAYVN
jgi:DNA-binding NtrC family response regulator